MTQLGMTLRDFAADDRLLPARRANWVEMLDAWAARARTTPFSWGHWDCCLAACTAVRMMTGFDPGMELRGRYRSERQAARLIRLVCRGKDILDISEWVVQRYGYERATDPLKLGDVCVCVVNSSQTMGVYTRHGIIVPSPSGSIVVNETPLMAWRP